MSVSHSWDHDETTICQRGDDRANPVLGWRFLGKENDYQITFWLRFLKFSHVYSIIRMLIILWERPPCLSFGAVF